MSLSADTLLDRIRLKRQLKKWRSISILLGVLAVLILLMQFGGEGSFSGLEKPFIARIKVHDIIADNQERTDILKNIRENEAIKAVVLHISSPGGTMVGGEALYDSLSKLAKKKPLVVVMGELAASGGYMVALPAQRIFAHKGTLTGSIGVYLQSQEFTELAQKIGVSFTLFKSAPLKGSPSPFEKITPQVTAALQETIMDNYNTFVDMVAAHRKMPREQVLQLADGRVFTGKQAVANGLIDAIGDEEDALEWLHTKKNISESLPVKEVKLKKPASELKELLSSTLVGPSLLPETLGLEGVLSLWHPGLFSHL